MSEHDYKKEWEKTKIQIVKFSKEALEIAKKGEKEMVKLSKKSKLFMDSKALGLKKEKLYYLIGKEYVKSGKDEKPSAKMKKLLGEIKAAEKVQKSLKIKIKKT